MNYLTVTCIDVKYSPIYIYITEKVCKSRPCNMVTKVIVGGHTQLLWFIYD